jgi:urease alpha subunit
VTFVASGVDRDARARRIGTRRALVVAEGMRGLTRASLVANRAVAPVDIDVRTGAVSLAGRSLAAEPVAEVPLSRRYLLR